jgi:hypothetical protein
MVGYNPGIGAGRRDFLIPFSGLVVVRQSVTLAMLHAADPDSIAVDSGQHLLFSCKGFL